MRLFVAIDVPEYLKLIIARLIDSLKQIEHIRAVNERNMHINLEFLGEVKDISPVLERLQKIHFEPFTIKTSKIGFFPNKDHIKVIWLGIEYSRNLLSLQEKIAVNKETKYVPHITLARISKIKKTDKKKLLETLSNVKIGPHEIVVDKFKLYESKLTEIGPIHTTVQTFSANLEKFYK